MSTLDRVKDVAIDTLHQLTTIVPDMDYVELEKLGLSIKELMKFINNRRGIK